MMRPSRFLLPAARAALLAFALLCVAPLAAHAVAFAEFGTRCADGDTSGSFIEITGNANESTRNGMRLRAYDRNGTVIFDMDAYGARGAQVFTFQDGTRRFLFATTAMIAALGGSVWGALPLGYADNILPFALDPVGGRLMLYLIVNGREQIASQVRYGPGQLSAPPPGMSLQLGSGSWTIEPQTRLDSFFHHLNPGITPANGCLASPGYRMSEIRLQCEDGSTDGQYIAVEATGPIGSFSETVTLRALDHTGALIGTTTEAFSYDRTSDAFLNRRWMLAAPGFTPGGPDTADARLPFTLDPSGGTLQMSVSLAGITYSSDAFVYGTTFVPLPATGLSYVRTGASTLTTRVGDPRNSHGQRVEMPECAAGSGVPRPIVRELALECADGRPQGQFVELGVRGARLPIDRAYSLRVFRRDGAQAFEVQDVFAGFPVESLARERSWLLIPASDPRASLANIVLPDTLDRDAGALELWHPGMLGDSLLLRFEWGAPPLARPPAGGSLDAITNPVRPVAYPTPKPWSQTALPHDDCTSDQDLVPLSVIRLGLDCTDGSRAAAFAELDQLTLSHVRDPRLGLRWLAGNGVELARVEPLFPPRADWPLADAPHWLVASPSFEDRTALAPDRTWTGTLSESPALLQLYRRDPVTNAISTMGTHTLQGTLLSPGRAEVRIPSGGYESGSVVTPQRFDGARVASGACWSLPHPEAVRLSAVLLRCRAGEPGGQYVQLAASGTESMYSPDLLLRLRDAAGSVLGELRAPFPPAFLERSWPRDRALLVGGAGFAGVMGVAPDATLPAALDPTGGRIELALAALDQPEILLDALDYGPGGVAVPPDGAALVFTDGAWRVETFPRANGISLSLAAPTPCLGECPGRTMRFAVGGDQVLTALAGHETDTGAELTYDGARGTFALRSTFRDMALRWDDRYVIEGVAPGTPLSIVARVRHRFTTGDTCVSQQRTCYTSAASATLGSGTLRDSVDATMTPRSFELPLTVRAGEAFDLRLSLRAVAVSSPVVPAETNARLEFAGLPDGARVRSCSGFDTRNQRGIGTPSLDATPRRIDVSWAVTGEPGSLWAIERRIDDGEWQPFESRSADPDQVLRISDTRVSPGHTYAYRAGWSDEYGSYTSPAASTLAPAQPGYALHGVFPNPSTGAFQARIEIPEAGQVHLELIDVAGRVVASQSRWLEPGLHVQPLARDGSLSPGIYTVRMKYRGLESWSRVVVLR